MRQLTTHCGHHLAGLRQAASKLLCCVGIIAKYAIGLAQVVICHNHLSSQEEVSHALTHELIHAYDHCRSRDLDWSNCEHHACSEARSPPAGLSAFGLLNTGSRLFCCWDGAIAIAVSDWCA